MTTLIQIAPGVVFAAEVLNPKWGQSLQPDERSSSRHGSNRSADNTRDSHDAAVCEEDRGEQIALL